MSSEDDLQKFMNELSAGIKSLLVRQEARVDLHDQQLAIYATQLALANGIINALIEHFDLENDEEFAVLLQQHTLKILATLQAGTEHAENTSDEFVSKNPGSTGEPRSDMVSGEDE